MRFSRTRLPDIVHRTTCAALDRVLPLRLKTPSRLRHPRLLLLDEATSQLDAVNEAALRDTIAEAARTTTVLVVAD